MAVFNILEWEDAETLNLAFRDSLAETTGVVSILDERLLSLSRRILDLYEQAFLFAGRLLVLMDVTESFGEDIDDYKANNLTSSKHGAFSNLSLNLGLLENIQDVDSRNELAYTSLWFDSFLFDTYVASVIGQAYTPDVKKDGFMDYDVASDPLVQLVHVDCLQPIVFQKNEVNKLESIIYLPSAADHTISDIQVKQACELALEICSFSIRYCSGLSIFGTQGVPPFFGSKEEDVKSVLEPCTDIEVIVYVLLNLRGLLSAGAKKNDNQISLSEAVSIFEKLPISAST